MMWEGSLINWVGKKEVEYRPRNRAALRRKMPPDRRSSGKQKRLHTLLSLICVRVLSSAGSVSVTPSLPPRPLSFHLIPPSPTPPPTHQPNQLSLLAVDPRYQARADVRGGRRRRLIARQRLPPQRLWEPRAQPSSTQWPGTSTARADGGKQS